MADNFPPLSNPVEIALGLKKELDEFEKTNNRAPLIEALKQQFLSQRLSSSVQAERARDLALTILIGKINTMSDNMLLRTIAQLSEIGHLDLASITGNNPNSKAPMININQAFGQQPSQIGPGISNTGINAEGNPIKDANMLLESMEHITAFFRDRELKTIDVVPKEGEENKNA